MSHLDPPIFIIGYMHSGTTLLQQILGRHGDVLSNFGETRLFDSLPIVHDKFPDLEDDQILRAYVDYLIQIIQIGFDPINLGIEPTVEPPVLDINDRVLYEIYASAQKSSTYEKIFINVFNHLAIIASKNRWLEKTPTHLFHVAEIMNATPDAKFIELVRDGRDVLASKKSRVVKGSDFNTLWDILAWKSAINSVDAARKQYPDNIWRIRYEDFVSNPERELRRMCDWLGLEFDAMMLKVGWINSTTSTGQRVKSGIGTAAIGRWRKVLTPTEAAFAQLIAGKHLVALGYPVEKFPLIAYIGFPAQLGKSFLEFFSRLYSRWRMGGFPYLLNVLNNYRLRLLGLVRR
jgi:hypothetical protein